ncbi:MAG TPA: precorrin-8X methylmutase [Aestuariivirga sp.]|nr:precorrin-8X methylmutase [Aestuariivirga sp.]
MIEYLRDPKAIYARSFAIIRAETSFSHLPRDCEAVAARIVHACGMPEIAADLRISSNFCKAAKRAIRTGRGILVDAEMVRHGIIDKSLKVICTLNYASANGTTRSAAAVELWRPHLEGALVVVGNAPTALFALLDLIDAGAPRPAAIVGFPVGFVGAAESKAELHRNPRGTPYATLLGRKGGSAMAAAVINALTQNAA